MYVVPPDAVSAVDEPLQIATFEPAFIDGSAFTITVTDDVLLHPDALVPVTVYTLVALGLAVTLAPVVAERPVDGVQE